MLADLRAAVFPRQCAGCGAKGAAACAGCLAELRTHSVTLSGGLTVHCASDYGGWVRDALIAFKSGDRSQVHALGAVLGTVVSADVVLVPVPTSRLKRQERGFDTIGELVEVLPERGPVIRVVRQSHTVPDQVGLSPAQRQTNVVGAFAATRLVSGAVTVVDDVVTTGATMREVAAVLRRAGAHPVSGIALCSARRLG